MSTVKQKQETSQLARGLTGLLADSYVLYNTTQNFHWNVTGPQFKSLHDLFEAQYRELAAAIDTIAERIRCLDVFTPGRLEELLAMTRVEQEANVTDPDRMLERLVEGHRIVIHRLKELQQLAEKQVDEATLDLLIERQRVHEKTVWFLRSQAGEDSSTLDMPTAHAIAS